MFVGGGAHARHRLLVVVWVLSVHGQLRSMARWKEGAMCLFCGQQYVVLKPGEVQGIVVGVGEHLQRCRVVCGHQYVAFIPQGGVNNKAKQ